MLQAIVLAAEMSCYTNLLWTSVLKTTFTRPSLVLGFKMLLCMRGWKTVSLANATMQANTVLDMCTADTDTVCQLILLPHCSKQAFCCADGTIPGIIWAAPTVGTQTANCTSAMCLKYRYCYGKHPHLADIGQQLLSPQNADFSWTTICRHVFDAVA